MRHALVKPSTRCPRLDSVGTLPGNWFYVFPENVKTYGISATRSLGDFNFAAEASIRDGAALRSTNILYGFFPGQPRPAYATGRTAHVNLSATSADSRARKLGPKVANVDRFTWAVRPVARASLIFAMPEEPK